MADANKKTRGVDHEQVKPSRKKDTIFLFFKDNTHRARKYKVKRQGPLKRCMRDFASHAHMDITKLRFIFDGERVAEDCTPAEMEMETNDIIHVYQEAVGGGDELDSGYDDASSTSSWSVVSIDDECVFPEEDGSSDEDHKTAVGPSKIPRPIHAFTQRPLEEQDERVENTAHEAPPVPLEKLPRHSPRTSVNPADLQRQSTERPNPFLASKPSNRTNESTSLKSTSSSTAAVSHRPASRSKHKKETPNTTSRTLAAASASVLPADSVPMKRGCKTGKDITKTQSKPPGTTEIKIYLLGPGGAFMSARANPHRQLDSVFESYGFKFNTDATKLLFQCNGMILWPSDTPKAMGISEYDTIQVYTRKA